LFWPGFGIFNHRSGFAGARHGIDLDIAGGLDYRALFGCE